MVTASRCTLSLRAALGATAMALGLLASPAQASLGDWRTQVAGGTAASYAATHIFLPSAVDIGAVSGDITWEFIVNGQDRSASGTLIGALTGGPWQAIRFTVPMALSLHGEVGFGRTLPDGQLCDYISALVLRNRGAGPFGLPGMVDERCGGVFDDIDQVIPAAEREAFMARYKAAAGFAIGALNAALPTIAPGVRVRV